MVVWLLRYRILFSLLLSRLQLNKHNPLPAGVEIYERIIMKYTEFISKVCRRVQELCEENGKVTIQRVVKNNSVELDGLVIKREGRKASPTIYLDEYYRRLIDGEDFEYIVRKILEADEIAGDNFNIALPEFDDVSQMRDKIVCKIINTDKNSLLLEKIPHREYLDFSLVYYCVIDNTLNVSATFLINNMHMSMWGLDESMLYDIAMKNTLTMMPPVIVRIEDILSELMEGDCPETMGTETNGHSEENDDVPMYILSNEKRVFGAVHILDENIMREFAKEHGSFYILPSSVHELILIPVEQSIDRSKLCSIVREINETQVPADEILSDYVYIYDDIDSKVSKLNFVNENSLYT